MEMKGAVPAVVGIVGSGALLYGLEVAAHLRAVRLRETLIDSKHVTTLRHFAKTLDSLGINRPADDVLEGRLQYVWERYIYLFLDKVASRRSCQPAPDGRRTSCRPQRGRDHASRV